MPPKKPSKKKIAGSARRKKPVIPKSVEFHYIKGPDFRSLHVDGAIGGMTSRGVVHVAFYSERGAIPKKTVSKVLPSGNLGEELVSKREGKSGIVRQLEVDIFMTEAAVRDLRNWLNVRLEEFETARQLSATRKKAN